MFSEPFPHRVLSRGDYPLRPVTLPSALPVTLDEAKGVLGEVSNDKNSYISGLIATVTHALDGRSGYLNRCLMPQVWALDIDYDLPLQSCLGANFIPLDESQKITCPLWGSVRSITSFTYVDVNGAPQTLSPSDYRLILADLGSLDNTYLLPATGASWPLARNQPRTVTITFTAGFSDFIASPTADQTKASQAAVPEQFRTAILLMVRSLFDGRDEGMWPKNATDILKSTIKPQL